MLAPEDNDKYPIQPFQVINQFYFFWLDVSLDFSTNARERKRYISQSSSGVKSRDVIETAAYLMNQLWMVSS